MYRFCTHRAACKEVKKDKKAAARRKKEAEEAAAAAGWSQMSLWSQTQSPPSGSELGSTDMEIAQIDADLEEV
jgi:hypothetical protein